MHLDWLAWVNCILTVRGQSRVEHQVLLRSAGPAGPRAACQPETGLCDKPHQRRVISLISVYSRVGYNISACMLCAGQIVLPATVPWVAGKGLSCLLAALELFVTVMLYHASTCSIYGALR